MTQKEELFCLAYVGSAKFNATEAARIAGYSEKTASAIGHENLRKPKIAEKVRVMTEQRLKDAGYSADRIIKEIIDVAFADLSSFVAIDGNGKLSLEWDPEIQPTAALQELYARTEATSGGGVSSWITKIKLHDKKWALEMLSKLLDMKSGDIGGTVININLRGKNGDE